MTETQRRTATRWPANRTGRYRLSNTSTWQACRLIDISQTGAAVEPLDLTTDKELAFGALDLEPLSSEDGPLHFHGNIKHMTRSSEGPVRLGIEFTGLTTLETNLLALLVHSKQFA